MKQFKRQSQNDKRWSRKLLGACSLTIGGHGCLVTDIANACGLRPDEVVARLEFTDNGHKYGPGLILWNDANKKALYDMGLEFIGRYDSWTEKDLETVKELCNSKDYIPILEVRTKTNGRHWVLPIGRALTWRGIGWATNDPWNGKREWKTVGIGAPYKWETGWVLFKKVN